MSSDPNKPNERNLYAATVSIRNATRVCAIHSLQIFKIKTEHLLVPQIAASSPLCPDVQVRFQRIECFLRQSV